MTDVLREGIPHIWSTNKNAPSLVSTVSRARDNLYKFLGDGHLHAVVTEKTDGMVFEVGYDNTGMWSRTAHSPKRKQNGYSKDRDTDLNRHFDSMDYCMRINPYVKNLLMKEYKRTNKPVSIKGEMFWRKLAKKSDEFTITQVATPYNNALYGYSGMFVIHAALESNLWMNKVRNFELKDLSNEIKFYNDIYTRFCYVDLKDELLYLNCIDGTTPILKRSDERWVEIVEIARRIKEKLHDATEHLSPLFGDVREGIIFHPNGKSKPRVKIVRDNYLEDKKDLIKWAETSK